MCLEIIIGSYCALLFTLEAYVILVLTTNVLAMMAGSVSSAIRVRSSRFGIIRFSIISFISKV